MRITTNTRVVYALASLVLATAASRRSAALDPKVPLAELTVQRWSVEHGLPSAKASVVVRADDGLLYIGTDLGLVAFDGLSFERHDKASDPALPANAIEVLQPQGRRLWIGTPRGLALREAGVVRALDAGAGLGAQRVLAMTVDARGALWVATADGVFVQRDGGDTMRFAPLETEPGKPLLAGCSGLVPAPDGAWCSRAASFGAFAATAPSASSRRSPTRTR